MITCSSCSESDDLSGTRLDDGRLKVRCGACGHEWTRGVAASPSPPRPAAPPLRPTGLEARTRSSAAEVNERATAAVIVELERRGAVCRIERVAANRREIRFRTDASGPDIAVVVRARTRGDWQTRASYGQPRQPEEHPMRFWIFVDLQPAAPVFFIHPEWAVLNDIFVNHQQYLDANGGRRIVNDDSDHHSIRTERVAGGRGRWDQLPGIARGRSAPPQ